MHVLLAAFALLTLIAQPVYAAPGRVVTLILPHKLQAGETAWLELKVGVIERGAEIEITTKEGRFLGVISPFGIPSGGQAGIYTVPLPADVISKDRVALRLTLNRDGHVQRAPTAKELKSLRVKITPATQ